MRSGEEREWFRSVPEPKRFAIDRELFRAVPESMRSGEECESVRLLPEPTEEMITEEFVEDRAIVNLPSSPQRTIVVYHRQKLPPGIALGMRFGLKRTKTTDRCEIVRQSGLVGRRRCICWWVALFRKSTENSCQQKTIVPRNLNRISRWLPPAMPTVIRTSNNRNTRESYLPLSRRSIASMRSTSFSVRRTCGTEALGESISRVFARSSLRTIRRRTARTR